MMRLPARIAVIAAGMRQSWILVGLVAPAPTELSADSFLSLTQCFGAFFQADTLVIR